MLRADSIRSQCLVILSSLIEVFGDNAISALLLFIQNIFLDKKPDQNLAKENEEEVKVIQENDDVETLEFQALLQEHIYMSEHPKHVWKRREVGLLLLGVFLEDV